MWPGQPGPTFATRLHIESDGVFLREITFWEHTGTHVDAPGHFFPGAMTVDQIPPERLVCPAVVIDVSAICSQDPDYALTVEDVLDHEARHGRVREGSAVLLHTGWGKFASDLDTYYGTDAQGGLHFPGYGREAGLLLVKERGVVGLGIDTLGVDAGAASGFPIHSEVGLPNAIWQLEELVRLDEVPPTGAWIVVGVLPWVGGSGSPARALALIP